MIPPMRTARLSLAFACGLLLAGCGEGSPAAPDLAVAADLAVVLDAAAPDAARAPDLSVAIDQAMPPPDRALPFDEAPPPDQAAPPPDQALPPDDGGDARCAAAGAAPGMALCCLATNDYPNQCKIGGCSCAPGNSHMVKTCVCPMGKCFNGVACQ